MKLHCPHCGVKGSAEDSYSGRKVKCPKCQGVFTVAPDMALELAEDATPVSPTTVETSLSASEVDTIHLTEEEVEQPVTEEEEAVSVVAVDEQIEIAGDLSEPEVVAAPAEEEELDWEDVASEIDLQENEALVEEKEEETIELEEPVDAYDLSGEDDGAMEDDASDSRVIDAAEDPGPAMTEESAEMTETMETTESVEEREEDVLEEDVEVEEEKETKEQPEPTADEPSGTAQEQCWQCGKTASGGESFVVKEDRLYCPVCLPAEEPQEAVVASQEQGSDTTSSVDAGSGQASDKISLGGVIKKTWAKIRSAWSS